MLTHLSLFSGIGGLDLAAEWAGFATVGQCEWADYPTQVLEKHWPDVPRWRDIRTLTKEDFYERTGLRTVDVISGGFPCQPFSVAGKQKGKGDDRYLWPEMLRVIRELTPRWIVGENVPGILRIAAADVVSDLEREGYNIVVFDFEAASVGAPHRRERVFFVAHRDNGQRNEQKDEIQTRRDTAYIGREDVAHAESGRTGQRNGGCATRGLGSDSILCNTAGEPRTERRAAEPRLGGVADGLSRWLDEPDIPRVTKSMPNRANRLKCLGNAVVPQQAYPIFKAIAEQLKEDNK